MDQGLLAEFLAECGLDAPYRVEVFSHDDATTQLHEFHQPFLVVGQRESSDLRLDHWLVGRRHIYLQLIDGRFRCIDLGARTGTHGGIVTERAGWVDPERPLRIGPYLVRPVVPIDADRPYPPLPIVTWSRVDKPANEPRWAMNRALVLVGRSPFCEFRLPDPTVSRFHCGLVLTAQGVWVVDLLSQKPVLVNGQASRFAPVRPGDILQVGPFALTPHYDMSLIRAVHERTDRSPVDSAHRPGGSVFLRETDSGNHDRITDQLPALAASVIVPAGHWERDSSGEVDYPNLGPNELVVSALVQQFGAMQQQMFDQFHQMMMGMFERFAELHRETSSTVRAEVDEVRKLSGEIESLRTETARLAEVSTLAMQQSAFDHSRHHQPAPALPTHPLPPSSRAIPGANRPGAVPPAGPIPSPSPSTAAAGSGRRPVVPPTVPVNEPPLDIHALLCSRLNQMETERQGRWQKILAMMSTSRS